MNITKTMLIPLILFTTLSGCLEKDKDEEQPIPQNELPSRPVLSVP